MDKADSAPVIRLLAEDDRPAWLSLRQALWMGSDATTRAAETGALLSEPQRFGALAYGVLLAFAGTRAIGFIEVSLRDDLPAFAGRAVGYVEGVYVEPSAQSRGLGRALLHAAEAWARARGAGDLVSDVLADNAASLDFHARVGFVAVGETVTADRRQVLLAKRLA